MLTNLMAGLAARPLQSGLVPRGTRVEVFNQIYWVFLALGTLVGIVVIGYMLLNAYKYRAGRDGETEKDEDERPQLGEIPTGGGGGRKLFLSFSLSAIIVISLIVWTYGTLLYVEGNPPTADQQGENVAVEVIGHQFFWQFNYMSVDGQSSDLTVNNTLRVPADTGIRLQVTSNDVFHNFGAPGLRVKSDAIPGETTDTWFVADETGTYTANCYELCGVGHSFMNAKIVVMEPEKFDQWYASQTNQTSAAIHAPA